VRIRTCFAGDARELDLAGGRFGIVGSGGHGGLEVLPRPFRSFDQ
jgi:hypothetical protein